MAIQTLIRQNFRLVVLGLTQVLIVKFFNSRIVSVTTKSSGLLWLTSFFGKFFSQLVPGLDEPAKIS